MSERDDTGYLIMEHLESPSLENRIAQNSKMPLAGCLAPVQLLAAHVGSGLQAAYSNHSIHFDITPKNILLAECVLPSGLLFMAKVLDFASSRRRTTTEKISGAPKSRGNLNYVTPEIARQRAEMADARTDKFSLGVALYEALTGTRPFQRDTFAETLQAICEEEPLSLGKLASGLPSSMEAALRRAFLFGAVLVGGVTKITATPSTDTALKNLAIESVQRGASP